MKLGLPPLAPGVTSFFVPVFLLLEKGAKGRIRRAQEPCIVLYTDAMA